MIYVRCNVNGQEIRTVISNDKCFFSDCPVCGIQVSVETDLVTKWIDDGEISDLSVYCDSCSEKYQEDKKPKLTIVK